MSAIDRAVGKPTKRIKVLIDLIAQHAQQTDGDAYLFEAFDDDPERVLEIRVSPKGKYTLTVCDASGTALPKGRNKTKRT